MLELIKKKKIYKKMLKLLEMLKIFGMNGVNNIWSFYGNIFKNNFFFICFEKFKLIV